VTTVAVIGAGYAGAAIALEAISRGFGVVASSRRQERREAFRAAGCTAISLDFAASVEPSATPIDGAVICFAPAAGLEASAVADAVRWAAASGATAIVYLSSTQVYGPSDGAAVDDFTPTNAASGRAHARLAAERAFCDACAVTGARASILRLPGIYGPGRTLRERIAAGRFRMPGDGSAVTNRIHVEDLATAVLLALALPSLAGIVLVADDEPATLADQVAWICAETGLPQPPSIALDELPPSSREFFVGNRYCRARRLADAGWRPRYRNFREGFAAAWRAALDPRAALLLSAAGDG
jgi:nucleoside-diphosphate-sugar epimerase